MSAVIKAFSGPSFINNKEVLSRLPKNVPLEFTLEFSKKGETIIVITSPKYPGILSEAKDMEKAYENAHDAILTYFEIPRSYAKVIQFKIVGKPHKKAKGINNVLLHHIEIKLSAHA